jgi:trehalose 6-phosphate synthase/phosphatase
MQKRIANYDVQAWAEDFMAELKNIKDRQQSFQIKFLDEYSKRSLFDRYRTSRKRLLLLDYDGTLVSFSSNPEMAVPGEDLLTVIRNLCAQHENDVYLISGRSSAWLEKHFGHLPVNFIAEHGAKHKSKSGQWISEVQTNHEWKEQVHNVMEMYVRRCANSMVEEKDFSMVWHYRNANIEQGKLRAYELVSELNEYIRNRHLQVLMGNKIVEVRQSGINKGTSIKNVIAGEDYDFIFAVGDDRTDEDMFKALIGNDSAVTIKVGPEASYAQFNLHTPHMVVSLLDGMTHVGVSMIAS